MLASTLLWIHQTPPTMWGVSVFGVTGVLFAGLLMVRLLLLMRRDERA